MRTRLKGWFSAAVLLLTVTLPLLAAEGTEEHGEMLGWKWANFALLAFGLGYLAAKNLPPFFRSRGDEIRKGIDEAARMKADAEAKAAGIEQRLASIGADIEKLRAQLKAEVEAEGARIQEDTERQMARLQEQAEQEITFMTKASRQELKAYSADLALDLAKERIRSQMAPEVQHRLVDGFVSDLRQPGPVQ